MKLIGRVQHVVPGDARKGSVGHNHGELIDARQQDRCVSTGLASLSSTCAWKVSQQMFPINGIAVVAEPKGPYYAWARLLDEDGPSIDNKAPEDRC